MSYQERRYNQNGKFNRNSVGPVPTLSSDISIFNRPSYIISGATSIECPSVTCDINDIPYNDIFTGTTDCFTVSALSGSCFNSIDWVTNIYEDSVLKYTKNFYSSTGFTGPIIDVTTFSGSVVTAFDTLNYDYTFDGTGFTVTNDTGVKNLILELTTELDYDVNCPVTGNTTGFTSCSCPAGYTATTTNNICKKITTTASTYNGAPFTIAPGDNDGSYGSNGAYFWPSLDGLTLPLHRGTDTANILNQGSDSGPVVTATANVNNSLWGGRLNNVGIKASNAALSNEWFGFSKCIDIATAGTYYVGIAGDNRLRFKLNGDYILIGNDSYIGRNWKVWHMIPVTLNSGINLIEMEGRNIAGSDMAFSAEIYSADTATLISATSIDDTGLVFTTSGLTGEFDIGTTVGYSCPSGYALNNCGGGTPVCSLIETSPEDCVFTGTCETKETVCNLDFSGITINDENVYVLTGQTEFNLTFDFTGNTSSFIDNNANFRYNIHKYIPGLSKFDSSPIYSSEYINWPDFSGTSAYTAVITATTLNPDGEYLVKCQFKHDISTEFGKKLGYNYTTVPSTNGDPYGIYQSNKDKYFVVFKDADTPLFTNNEDDSTKINALVVSSTILDGTGTEFNLPANIGDYIISLNGITLSPEHDYSIQENVIGDNTVSFLKLSGQTVNGDILTYVFTNDIDSNNLKYDSFDVSSPIVSGATNGQGSNKIYYNTTKGKYELYLTMVPVSSNDITVTLNGVTLANNIDYFQSSTNPKRIILEGNLIVSDILNTYYNTSTNVQGNQSGTGVTISWLIETQPVNNDGLFTVQIASDENFGTIISSGTTSYIAGETNYSKDMNLVGSLGDKQYYRVKNEKKFKNLCGETLTTEKESESIEITIQTISNNSY